MNRSIYRLAGDKYWKINGRKVVEVNFEDEDMTMIIHHKFSLLNHKKMGHVIKKSQFDTAMKKALRIIKS